MSVAASPSIAPQILIENATYGWTPDLLAGRKKATQKKIFDLQAIRQRRSVGLAVSAADNRKLRELPELQDELKRLNKLREGFVDIRDHVQRRVELAGGAGPRRNQSAFSMDFFWARRGACFVINTWSKLSAAPRGTVDVGAQAPSSSSAARGRRASSRPGPG